MYFYTLITQGGPGWGDKDTFPTALRALEADWTMAPHKLQTQRFDDGTGTGHGRGPGFAMMQCDPADATTFRPMFLHSNLVKLSVRRLMCAECLEDESALNADERNEGKDVMFKGRIIMHEDELWEALNFSKRIYSTRTEEGLNDMGRMNTERDLWRVMERSACVGVFGDAKICQRTRRHLDKTFGTVGRWRGESNAVCA